MFEAAGLMGFHLVPITVAHVTGRLVSFALYIGAAGVAERSLGATLASSLTTPYGVVVQIALAGQDRMDQVSPGRERTTPLSTAMPAQHPPSPRSRRWPRYWRAAVTIPAAHTRITATAPMPIPTSRAPAISASASLCRPAMNAAEK